MRATGLPCWTPSRHRWCGFDSDALTPHEEAVLTNIAFMESVHAKSQPDLPHCVPPPRSITPSAGRRKIAICSARPRIVLQYYRGDEPPRAAVASTPLESSCLHSGF